MRRTNSATIALMEVLHRDLTPHNLMVSATGRLRIIDFGIATTGATQPLQHQRGVKGKTHYLSPECNLQRTQDRRSDVFTLGVVGFELLTGERLEREQPAAPYPIPLQLRRDGVPSELQEALERAIAHNPNDRWASAAELQEAIAPFWAAQPERTQRDTAAFVQQLVGEVVRARRNHYRAMKHHLRIPLTALKDRTWEDVQATMRGSAVRVHRQRERAQRFVMAFVVTTLALLASAQFTPSPGTAPTDAARSPLRIAIEIEQDLALKVSESPSVRWLEPRIALDRISTTNAMDFDALLLSPEQGIPEGWRVLALSEVHGQTTRLQHLVASNTTSQAAAAPAGPLCVSGTSSAVDDAVQLHRVSGTRAPAFRRIEQMATPEKVLRAVHRGGCSSGLVRGSHYATAPLFGLPSESLRIVNTIRGEQTPVVIVRDTLPAPTQERLREALTHLEVSEHSTPRMQDVITGFTLTPGEPPERTP